MSRTIQLTRNDLVWETRCISWDETDYADYLNSLRIQKEKLAEDPNNIDAEIFRYSACLYDCLSQYTWEQICNLISDIPFEEQPKFEYTGKYRDGSTRTSSRYISEIIEDAIREECYEQPVVYTDYADDFQEDWNDSAATSGYNEED